MTARYTGDLAELRRTPGFDWSLGAMDTYLRELDLRRADGFAKKARQLEVAGAPHYDVMAAYAGAESASCKYPDVQAEHRAATDAYAARHGLRGWHRYAMNAGAHRGCIHLQVNYLRTPEQGEVGRYYTHAPILPGYDEPKIWVIDRDTGRTVAMFGAGEKREDATRKARSWIYTTESGGC
jgi:hypothetical protein